MARPVEKREHIEHGMLTVVARKGLRGSTIQEIAEAASVSPGLLYRYWKSRDDLAVEVYRKNYAALTQRLAGLALSERDASRRLALLVRAFLSYADEHPLVLRFLLLSQHDLARSVPTEFGVRAMVERVLRDGVEQGTFRPVPPGLGLQLLLGLVLQPVVGVLYGDLQGPVSQYGDEICDAFNRLLRP
ncbi:MAG: TetR/AcrR family transcriptional regulator [Phycisphaerales bacterium]|nr:TetR/AcrR family transcriptional regulator [Phycisphaerales bacterium]